MTSVVAWLGPASPFQAPGWTPPVGAKVLNLQCQGLTQPTCGTITDGWADASGRHLSSLIAAGKMDPTAVDEVMLNAFSAGGSSVKRICMSADDRAAIPVVVLADGMYTTDRDAQGNAVAPEGFVRFALDALTGPHLFVATSSSNPNKSYPTGSQTLDAVRREVERRTGRTFQTGGHVPLPVQPVTLWTMGNVIFGDYQALLGHGEHVSVLNAAVWDTIVKPFLAARQPGVEPPLPPAPPRPLPPSAAGPPASSFPWDRALALLAGAAAGYAGVRWYDTRRH